VTAEPTSPYVAATPTETPTVAPTPYVATTTASKSPILSIISLIAGIIGVLGFWIVFIPFVGSILGLFIPAAAVVLGFLGKRKEPAASKGLWLTGIILGAVGIVIAIIGFVGWGLLVGLSGGSYY
jgi:hypothetical protein